MNTERLLAIASHIEEEPDSFDMGLPLNSCGTVGCVAGQACILFDPEYVEEKAAFGCDVLVHAADILNLDLVTRGELFLARSLDVVIYDDDGHGCHIEGYDRIPTEPVPQVLRWMVEHNNYNWSAAHNALQFTLKEPRT